MTEQEDWAIQLSIKHGPNLQYMTNVRGFTAQDIADHLGGLADLGKEITESANAYLALETIQSKFNTEPVREERRYGDRGSGSQATGFAARDGELCEPHKMPRKYKQIKSRKNGKLYDILECTNPNNPCDTIWDN